MEEHNLTTTVSNKGRAMELSELVMYDGSLWTFDDITGTFGVIDIKSWRFVPMMVKNYQGTDQPFKAEWATVYRDKMYVGSIGKEWVVNGTTIHNNCVDVKTLSKVSNTWDSLNWTTTYEKLRVMTNYTFPGYLQHEAVFWDPDTKNWMFLPRKASTDPYDVTMDETKGTNLMIEMDPFQTLVGIQKWGPLEVEWGFTSLKKLPRSDVYIATKVREIDDETQSKIGLFTHNGTIIGEWFDLGSPKFEGLEVVLSKIIIT
jgi:soluble calcium-activated nucleotidase 1